MGWKHLCCILWGAGKVGGAYIPSSKSEQTYSRAEDQKVKLSVKQPRFGWSGHSHGSLGTITTIDADRKLRIYTPVGSKTWMLHPSEVELVEEEKLCIGDWVRVRSSITTPSHHWGEVTHSSIGVIHRMDNGDMGGILLHEEAMALQSFGA
ncbi:hypothetical protein SLEP1_g5253 [Rubroshorea leprosula]|uniref:Mind bomb SH3 repeat domain-containing protein n=1 Tax=Rubroshorea leprosula TaxID=152421 RepID=A0AAV5HRM9_9ROSI|nr:hypothetical protein SLEP1_g5253 [Rubroshorea leprosula]